VAKTDSQPRSAYRDPASPDEPNAMTIAIDSRNVISEWHTYFARLLHWREATISTLDCANEDFMWGGATVS